ncbi:MAG TPA: hypothetical protein VIU65_00940 [Pyrinomonadaceae bacterium]
MKNPSRREFGKKLGFTLGALPITALAIETAAAQKKRKLTGDPITVGGGGGTVPSGGGPKVRILPFCTFDHQKYTSGDTGDKKTFRHIVQATHMTSLVVSINEDTFDLNSFLPSNGECHITVYCADGETFQIWGDEMRVKLHTRKYPANGNTHQSTLTTNFVERIVVDTPRGWFERVGLTVNDVIGIETSTS